MLGIELFLFFSHGKQLQVLLMSDLYHHLQGEIVGGRPLPTGPFQQIAAFLFTKEAELVGSIGKAPILEGIHPAYGNGYLYDTKALEAELGLEWWPQTESAVLPSSVVERTLSFLQRVNAMTSLGHSQLSALRAWSAVVTMSIFDKHGVSFIHLSLFLMSTWSGMASAENCYIFTLGFVLSCNVYGRCAFVSACSMVTCLVADFWSSSHVNILLD